MGRFCRSASGNERNAICQWLSTLTYVQAATWGAPSKFSVGILRPRLLPPSLAFDMCFVPRCSTIKRLMVRGHVTQLLIEMLLQATKHTFFCNFSPGRQGRVRNASPCS